MVFKFRPCGPYSLQTGTHAVAIVQIVAAFESLITNIISLFLFEEFGYAKFIIGICFALIFIGVSVILLFGAYQKKILHCQIWCVVVVVCVLLEIAYYFTIIALHESVRDIYVYNLPTHLINLVADMYMLTVVRAYIIELETGFIVQQVRLAPDGSSAPDIP